MDNWARTDSGFLESGTVEQGQPLTETPRHGINHQSFHKLDSSCLYKRAISRAMGNAATDPGAHASFDHGGRHTMASSLTHAPGDQVQPVPSSSSEYDIEPTSMSPAGPDSSFEERPQIVARLPGAHRWGDYYDMDRLRRALEIDGYWETNDNGERQSILIQNLPASRKHNLASSFTPAPERWLRQGIQFEFDYAHGLREKALQHPEHPELQSSSPPIRSDNRERTLVFPSRSQQNPNEESVAFLRESGPDEGDYKRATLQPRHTPIKTLAQQGPSPLTHNNLRSSKPTMQRLSRDNSHPSAFLGDSDNWLLPHPFKHKISLPSTGKTIYGESDNDASLDIPIEAAATGTPHTPAMGSCNNPVVQSPYFQENERVLGVSRSLGVPKTSDSSGSIDIGSSFELALSSSPQQSSLRKVSPRAPDFQFDPFTSETNVTQEAYTEIQRGLWHRQNDHQLQRRTRNKLSDSESYQPSKHCSGSESSIYSLALPSQNSSPWKQHSFHTDNSRSYVSSVYREELSPQITQTITPQPSPYGRSPDHIRIQGAVDRTHKTHDGTERAGFRPILSHIQPDSSILSPLRHKSGGRVGAHDDTISFGHSPQHDQAGTQSSFGTAAGRSWGDLHARVWNACHSGTATNLSITDVDLSSHSEYDSEDDKDPGNSMLPTVKPQLANGTSPRTPSASTEADRVVCAISESRSSDVVGIATINITLGQVDITRILNDDRYQRLTETLWRMPVWPQIFLVLKKIVAEQSKSLLVYRLKQHFPDAEVVPLDRAHWNESEGLRMIDRFAWRKDIKVIRANLEHNFYASCAFSAVRSSQIFCRSVPLTGTR